MNYFVLGGLRGMRLSIVAGWLACNGGSWLLLVSMLLVGGIGDESEYRPVLKG